LTNYEILQTIQNKAVKIAYNTPFKTNLKNLHISENIPLLFKFIITLTLKFFDKCKQHKNILVSNIPKKAISDLKYIDRYGTYRLPQHYYLFPPPDVTSVSAHATGRDNHSNDLSRNLRCPFASPRGAAAREAR
jgi:hypothetical protein